MDSFGRLCRARDLLREVHDERLTIDRVAREAAMSPFHFIRHLLALGEHSVTDVCMEVGFSSLGSFSDLFARRTGISPSEYRRQARSMVTVPGTLPRNSSPAASA